MLQTVEIRMRADDPEKGELYVYKYITRKLHPYNPDWTWCPDGWVKWRNHKWAVYHAGGNLYELGEIWD